MLENNLDVAVYTCNRSSWEVEAWAYEFKAIHSKFESSLGTSDPVEFKDKTKQSRQSNSNNKPLGNIVLGWSGKQFDEVQEALLL